MVNKAQISRYQDALSVLGLDRKRYEDWTESDKALFGEITALDAKHAKSAGTMVTKAESKAIQFAIAPQVHKGLGGQNFYCGPRTVDNETPSVFRYRPPGPTCKAAARASLGLPATAPEDTRRQVFTAREVARASLGL